MESVCRAFSEKYRERPFLFFFGEIHSRNAQKADLCASVIAVVIREVDPSNNGKV